MMFCRCKLIYPLCKTTNHVNCNAFVQSLKKVSHLSEISIGNDKITNLSRKPVARKNNSLVAASKSLTLKNKVMDEAALFKEIKTMNSDQILNLVDAYNSIQLSPKHLALCMKRLYGCSFENEENDKIYHSISNDERYKNLVECILLSGRFLPSSVIYDMVKYVMHFTCEEPHLYGLLKLLTNVLDRLAIDQLATLSGLLFHYAHGNLLFNEKRTKLNSMNKINQQSEWKVLLSNQINLILEGVFLLVRSKEEQLKILVVNEKLDLLICYQNRLPFSEKLLKDVSKSFGDLSSNELVKLFVAVNQIILPSSILLRSQNLVKRNSTMQRQVKTTLPLVIEKLTNDDNIELTKEQLQIILKYMSPQKFPQKLKLLKSVSDRITKFNVTDPWTSFELVKLGIDTSRLNYCCEKLIQSLLHDRSFENNDLLVADIFQQISLKETIYFVDLLLTSLMQQILPEQVCTKTVQQQQSLKQLEQQHPTITTKSQQQQHNNNVFDIIKSIKNHVYISKQSFIQNTFSDRAKYLIQLHIAGINVLTSDDVSRLLHDVSIMWKSEDEDDEGGNGNSVPNFSGETDGGYDDDVQEYGVSVSEDKELKMLFGLIFNIPKLLSKFKPVLQKSVIHNNVISLWPDALSSDNNFWDYAFVNNGERICVKVCGSHCFWLNTQQLKPVYMFYQHHVLQLLQQLSQQHERQQYSVLQQHLQQTSQQQYSQQQQHLKQLPEKLIMVNETKFLRTPEKERNAYLKYIIKNS